MTVELTKMKKWCFGGRNCDEFVSCCSVSMSMLLYIDFAGSVCYNAEHNAPLSMADHIGPMLKKNFPDSEISRNYHSARTKTACILNHAVAPDLKEKLVTAMQQQPYSPSSHASSVTGLSLMNPLTVCIYDVNRRVSHTAVPGFVPHRRGRCWQGEEHFQENWRHSEEAENPMGSLHFLRGWQHKQEHWLERLAKVKDTGEKPCKYTLCDAHATSSTMQPRRQGMHSEMAQDLM